MSKEESEMELDFEKVKEEKVKFLDSHHAIMLATSSGNRVTARTVTYASKGLDIYFMSWNHHKKCVQIKGNPRVALCRDNLSIEGSAQILDSPLDEKNKDVVEIYRNKLPKDYDGFARMPGMVMVRVTPTLMISWVRVGNKFLLEYLDLEKKRAYLERPER